MQRCLGRGVELFRVKLPRVEVGGISSSVGGAGPAIRAVRVFCGWDLTVGGSGGGAWELAWLVGPTHTMGIKGGNGHPRVIANCHSPGSDWCGFISVVTRGSKAVAGLWVAFSFKKSECIFRGNERRVK